MPKPFGECPFSYYALVLVVGYVILLLVVFRYQWRLFINKITRVAQKLFLGFTALQCMGRITYFIYWSFFSEDCSNPGSTDEAAWLNVFGNFPPPLFLSAFSVNVYTFARIYHTVLARQRYRFRVLYCSLITLNVVMYLGVLLNTLELTTGSAWVWQLLVSSLLIALGFFVYALLIYNDIKVRAEANGVPTPRMTQSMTLGWLVRRENNPMFKILVVATLCLACFLVRVAVLVSLQVVWGDKYPVVAVFCYLLFSEVLPLCLMLLIFETSPEPAPLSQQSGGMQNPLIHDDPKQISDSPNLDSSNFRHSTEPLGEAPDSPYTAASFSRPSWQSHRNPPRFSLPEAQPFTRDGLETLSMGDPTRDSPTGRQAKVINFRPRSFSQNALPTHNEQQQHMED